MGRLKLMRSKTPNSLINDEKESLFRSTFSVNEGKLRLASFLKILFREYGFAFRALNLALLIFFFFLYGLSLSDSFYSFKSSSF